MADVKKTAKEWLVQYKLTYPKFALGEDEMVSFPDEKSWQDLLTEQEFIERVSTTKPTLSINILLDKYGHGETHGTD